MKEIPLTKGKVALVDDEDFELVSQYKWHVQKTHRTFYAVTEIIGARKAGQRRLLSMQNLILPPPLGKRVDHKDRDGLNNQRSNLRHATNSQNCANRVSGKTPLSGYRGVRLYRQCTQRPWAAQFMVRGKTLTFGYYATPEEAARTYNEAASKIWGEFAILNDV